jgi:hypothetical protein
MRDLGAIVLADRCRPQEFRGDIQASIEDFLEYKQITQDYVPTGH